jgi:hypothetical protein
MTHSFSLIWLKYYRNSLFYPNLDPLIGGCFHNSRIYKEVGYSPNWRGT